MTDWAEDLDAGFHLILVRVVEYPWYVDVGPRNHRSWIAVRDRVPDAWYATHDAWREYQWLDTHRIWITEPTATYLNLATVDLQPQPNPIYRGLL